MFQTFRGYRVSDARQGIAFHLEARGMQLLRGAKGFSRRYRLVFRAVY